tara:strand:- start:401 stop:577 length:177 start_codon:yes stop_codon:yes gene_type:complete
MTYAEACQLTLGQVVRYTRIIPELMPFISPFAEAPDKPLKGDAAVKALRLMGVGKSNG